MKKSELENIRKEFPWFTKNKGWIYFDSAATALKPKMVIEAVKNYYEKISTNFHNKDSLFTYDATQNIYRAKKAVASWLKCDQKNLAFSYGATDSINLFAHGLEGIIKKDDEIIVTKDEHSSNLLPWWKLAQKKQGKLKIIKIDNFQATPSIFLSEITPKTKIIAFTSASNIYGYINDYEAITNEIKKRFPNIIIVIDAAQYVQHKRLIVNNNSKIDLLAFSFHKMYGPTGIGISYISDKLIGVLEPIRLGGGIFFGTEADLDKRLNFVTDISLYESGTQNLSSICAIENTIKFLEKINYQQVKEHEAKLTKYLITKLKKIKEITILNDHPDIPIICFNYKNIHPQDFANYLGRNKIIVRSGNSCVPLIEHNNKNQSPNSIQCDNNPIGFVRVSLAIYNTFTEIDKLIDTIKKFNKKEIITNVL